MSEKITRIKTLTGNLPASIWMAYQITLEGEYSISLVGLQERIAELAEHLPDISLPCAAIQMDLRVDLGVLFLGLWPSFEMAHAVVIRMHNKDTLEWAAEIQKIAKAEPERLYPADFRCSDEELRMLVKRYLSEVVREKRLLEMN